MSKARGQIAIDPARCKACELCIWACPQKSIKTVDEVDRRGIRIACCAENAPCTGCGFCYMVCPDTAITVYKENIAEEPAD
jgi:2-oxoglutarate ferredoxin oxidoreductase subunit delta